jgi:hypothetical protein
VGRDPSGSRSKWAEIQMGRDTSGPRSRWAEIRVGRNSGGSRLKWAEILVGRDPSGPRFKWAEIQVGRDSGGPRFRWAEIRVGRGGKNKPQRHLANYFNGSFTYYIVGLGGGGEGVRQITSKYYGGRGEPGDLIRSRNKFSKILNFFLVCVS